MRAYLTALLVFAAGCSGCASVPSFDTLRSTALRLEFAQALCSGTAIGPHTLMTAQHCLTTPLQRVNGQAVTVLAIGRDKFDTATVQVAGITFAHWATLGPTPKQGDRIRWFGQPEGNSDVYRQGYVARATGGVLVVDAPVCHGDSGSGLLDDLGRVVGVVSQMTNGNGCTFMLAHSL